MTPSREGREAGKELDAEVAERVFDAVVNRSERGGWGMFNRDGERLWLNADAKVPDFSSSVASAFLVVEAMRAKGWTLEIHSEKDGDGTRWIAGFLHETDDEEVYSGEHIASTPALAISLAALTATASLIPEKGCCSWN